MLPGCDRRAGMERRQFCYAFHLPERRLRMERRGRKNALFTLKTGEKADAWQSSPNASHLRRD
jgi:hypothetical protein